MAASVEPVNGGISRTNEKGKLRNAGLDVVSIGSEDKLRSVVVGMGIAATTPSCGQSAC